MQELINKVKTDLRISHNALNSDIADQIESCLQDLRVTAGIDVTDLADPLVVGAVKLYVRANYTDDTDKAVAYQERYDRLKASLQMASGYGRT